MVFLIGALMLFCGVLAAQERPHIGYLYPAGMQQGHSATILIGGQGLEGVTNILIAGDGVTGRILSFNREMDKQAVRQLTDRKTFLEDKLNHCTDPERPDVERDLARVTRQLSYAEKTPEDDPDMVKYLSGIQKKKQPNAQLTDLVRVEIRASDEAAAGPREVRLAGARVPGHRPLRRPRADLHAPAVLGDGGRQVDVDEYSVVVIPTGHQEDIAGFHPFLGVRARTVRQVDGCEVINIERTIRADVLPLDHTEGAARIALDAGTERVPRQNAGKNSKRV
jgi:hypothetical protein